LIWGMASRCLRLHKQLLALLKKCEQHVCAHWPQ
jgi:hypothetical protein